MAKKTDDSVYADVLAWTLTNYQRIIATVQIDTTDEQARRTWTDKADKELTALKNKWSL